jgi:hypothetical protein
MVYAQVCRLYEYEQVTSEGDLRDKIYLHSIYLNIKMRS